MLWPVLIYSPAMILLRHLDLIRNKNECSAIKDIQSVYFSFPGTFDSIACVIFIRFSIQDAFWNPERSPIFSSFE